MEIDKSITVKPLSKTNSADFERLFKAKGGLSYCWCMAWRMTSDELKHNTSANRKKFIRKRISSATPIGLLVYEDDTPIAWCSIAPRETNQRLNGDERLEKVWSIACFYIQKERRRKGLTNLLIEKAKSYAKENGAHYVKAYAVEADSRSYRHMGFIETSRSCLT